MTALKSSSDAIGEKAASKSAIKGRYLDADKPNNLELLIKWPP